MVSGERWSETVVLHWRGLSADRELKSLLIGDRAALGQPERPLEKISAVFGKMLGPLIPANYRAIAAVQVARTLLAQNTLGRRPGRGALRRTATALTG